MPSNCGTPGEAGAEGATLIGSGPITTAPLHAVPWQEDGHDVCFLDRYGIRFAPSATICAAALSRAADAQADAPRLVMLADPTRDLTAAAAEAEEIARHFPAGRVDLAAAGRANSRFLQRHAEAASYLHLACHGEATVLAASDAALVLADGPMPASALAALHCSSLRLAVVSACQSGMVSAAAKPDESLSVGSVMLAAGAASAIASLWPVDSLATAMLMTRLYDEMLRFGYPPVEALRRAQMWLRDLTVEGEAQFLSEHPALAAEFARHTTGGDVRSRRGSSEAAGPSEAPWSHPDHWAGFFLLGA